MTSVATLRQRLEYVGTAFPNSLLEATFHAVELGAVEARRGGIQYIHALQEVAACKPELLNWPTLLVTYEEGREQVGMIFLERDFRALFLFRTAPVMISDRKYRPPLMSEAICISSTDDD